MAIWFNSVNCFDLSECRPRVDNVTVIFVKKKKNREVRLFQHYSKIMSTKRVWHSTYWSGLKADTDGIVEPGYNSGAMQSLEGVSSDKHWKSTAVLHFQHV